MSYIRQTGEKKELDFSNPQDIMRRVLDVHRITSAVLIWLEVQSCLRIGNERRKELSCADRHSRGVGTEAALTPQRCPRITQRRRSHIAGQVPRRVPAHQHQGQAPGHG